MHARRSSARRDVWAAHDDVYSAKQRSTASQASSDANTPRLRSSKSMIAGRRSVSVDDGSSFVVTAQRTSPSLTVWNGSIAQQLADRRGASGAARTDRKTSGLGCTQCGAAERFVRVDGGLARAVVENDATRDERDLVPLRRIGALGEELRRHAGRRLEA